MRVTALFLLACSVSFPGAPRVWAQQPQDLALKARGILKEHCYSCHGRDGNNEGGFNYAVELKTLVTRGKVIPGEPGKSRLYKRITNADDPMPPEDAKVRPSRDDLDLLKRWIEAGAPDVNLPPAKRAFLAEDDILTAIHADLGKLDERQRGFTRYFTITHLYNAGFSDDELQTYRHALSKLVNSLSWGRQIIVPQPIDSAKTIFRIDLRHYLWTPENWNALLAVYPYGVTRSGTRPRAVYTMTASPLPYIRGDWFVYAASMPPLYHELLQVPETEAELEKLVRVDAAANIRQEQVARAGFNSSGVSRNNRLIERHESSYGAYWKSYDFAGNAGRKNLFANPLGPGTNANQFAHDGGEIIFSLPNGLQGYLLTDENGKRLDKGPTTIVSDDRQPDRAVVNGVSCMSCHAKGMIHKADQVREHVLNNPNAFDKKDAATVLALYPAKEKFDVLLQEDAERFARAVEKTGAHLSKTEPIVALARRFMQELDLPLAAAESGVSAADFLKALARSPVLARHLGPLRTPGGTVQRDAFIAAFPELVSRLQLGAIPAPTAVASQAGKQPEKKSTTAEPFVKLTDKAPTSFLLKRIKPGNRVWSDKNYLFATIPAEMSRGVHLLRDSGREGWLEPGLVSLPRGGTVYAIVRWKYLGKEEIDEVTFAQFEKEGWTEVKAAVKTTFPAGEDWRWKALKKTLEPGDVVLQLDTINFGRRAALFVFNEIAAK